MAIVSPSYKKGNSLTVEFPSSTTYTVPSWAVKAQILIVGGGGGGATGSNPGGANAGVGGSGGVGSTPVEYTQVPVVASDILTISIGNAGSGGIATTSSIGNAGGAGGLSSVTGNGIDLYCPGASGGNPGNGVTPGTAVSTYSGTVPLNTPSAGPSGAGAVIGVGAAGSGASTIRVFTGASGGAGNGVGGNRTTPGGGGGSGLKKGGVGGAGSSSGAVHDGSPGNTPVSDAYGSGGGASSGALNATTGSAGGNGIKGHVRITFE